MASMGIVQTRNVGDVIWLESCVENKSHGALHLEKVALESKQKQYGWQATDQALLAPKELTYEPDLSSSLDAEWDSVRWSTHIVNATT